MQAFILSAGKGTRLLPYTKILPKPLFPILGKPIIEIILDQLKNSGIISVGINVFHLKEKLISFLKSYQRKNPQLEIHIFEEKDLMGTGGGIINAQRFFKEKTLIVNSDVLTNLDFKKLISYNLDNPVVLILCKGEKNNVEVDISSKTIRSFRNQADNLFTFTGIQIIDPKIIKFFPFKKDIIGIYQELIKKGIEISAYIENTSYFKDIGTIKNYLKAHEDILVNKIEIKEVPSYPNPLVIKSKKIGKNVIFKDWVYIEEDTIIEDNTQLSKVVSLKGSYVKSGIYRNKILV